MEKALNVIKQMQEHGVIKKYAIGGGIAALFYIEPILTYDIDIFFQPVETDPGLLALSSLYEYLKKRGYSPQKEHIIIEGIPVRFLPVFNELIEDAVNDSQVKKFKNIDINVMKLEYLMAIMLQTNRPKDKERLRIVLKEADLDRDFLGKILDKHNLKERFDKIQGET
jgi:hypothetical protein